MTPELRRIGRAQSPVVVVNDFSGAVYDVIDMAAAMVPFPSAAGTYYPGVRQPIRAHDAAWSYVERTLEAAAPFIGGGFDVDGFDVIEASFSMVTADPARLSPEQRSPHFDSTDPDYIAVLHYLTDTSGTAFFRQRATGIEIVDQGNVGTFIDTAKRAASQSVGYIHGSNPHYEQIGQVEGVRDRLAIYRGSMLHSGIIPPDATFSADPRVGRLTTNIFIKGRSA
ncbi:hypothetical protein FPZ24_00075 [Sphingomonas panacisoli]|uniref:Uncharacterized protein n=1 Tax=Sphingomonas panacisoli TaxID=1813879 RepID=A0A5B8LDS8_9SPHN|nr:DUF6445 family protein [Sphingomonas panacisoli]QDZ06066.1 hypothetical protein FPZ24_00075 [Sphingomonas panacisoli]